MRSSATDSSATVASLTDKADELNRRRVELFGGIEMSVAGNERIRTENNCKPRDIVAVSGMLLFGYNVFIGLKRETRIEDVLSLHGFEQTAEGFAFKSVAADSPRNFLATPKFVEEFKELYAYYKHARLTQVRHMGQKLLAVFRTGEKLTDVKVFRWAVDPDGQVTYIDNRGERDHVFPASHDFEWTEATRDQHVQGRHPHVNVLDEVFVETVGGDLTVKVEDNTEDGLGIYREPVDDRDQSLDDGEIHFARVGTLILLRILPYREKVVAASRIQHPHPACRSHRRDRTGLRAAARGPRHHFSWRLLSADRGDEVLRCRRDGDGVSRSHSFP